MDFELTSTFKPTGDQPQAIKEITEAVQSGTDAITLLGVSADETGTEDAETDGGNNKSIRRIHI